MEYTPRNTKQKVTLDLLDAFEGIEDMTLYAFDKYRQTQDNNWFISTYTGKETKLDAELIKPIETKINNEYYRRIDDRSFLIMIQDLAKIEALKMKYFTLSTIIETMSNGFAPDIESQTIRVKYIAILESQGFKMNIIASPEDDIEALIDISSQIQGIKTQISIIQGKMKEKGTKESVGLGKQMRIVEMALQISYRINPKDISVLEWIEMCELCEERAKKN